METLRPAETQKKTGGEKNYGPEDKCYRRLYHLLCVQNAAQGLLEAAVRRSVPVRQEFRVIM